MKPEVLLTHPLLPEAMEYLAGNVNVAILSEKQRQSKQAFIHTLKEKRGLLSLLTITVDREIIDAAPKLEVIANCAVGYNNIDVTHAQEKGIIVTNTPGVLTDTTADLTWALIMAAARRIPQADQYTREGRFSGWALDLFLGRELTGKCLGIIGMGRIGRAVAERARAFKMNTIYFDPSPLSSAEEAALQARFFPIDEVIAAADILTLHTTLSPETHHLISESRISLMKETSILVNVSRGPVIDERALAAALKERKIWAAGLDVYEREPDIEESLKSLDNVILLPHIGSATFATRSKMSMMAAKNLVQVLNGEPPDNPV